MKGTVVDTADRQNVMAGNGKTARVVILLQERQARMPELQPQLTNSEAESNIQIGVRVKRLLFVILSKESPKGLIPKRANQSEPRNKE